MAGFIPGSPCITGADANSFILVGFYEKHRNHSS